MRDLFLILLALTLGSACDQPGAPGPDADTDADTDVTAPYELSVTATALPSPSEGTYLVALGPERLAGITARASGEGFCPDCLTIPPEDCPGFCDRERLFLSTFDADGAPLTDATELLTYFPEGFDHNLGIPVTVPLTAERWLLLWSSCDNSSCGGAFARRSCTGHLATLDASGGFVGEPVGLFEGWWGTPQVVVNPVTGHRLILHAPPDWGSRGAARFTILDAQGAVLTPFTTVGSDLRLSQTAVAHGDGFLIVVTDRDPGGAASPPCAASCDCLEIISDVPATTAILAYPVSSAGALGAPVTVASPAALHEPRLVATAAGITLLGHRGDALGAFFRDPAGAWTDLGGVDAPSTLWLGALPLHGPQEGPPLALWVGADLHPENAQEVVVGAVDAAGTWVRHATGVIVPGYHFGPTQTFTATPDGGARFFIQRAGWPPDGSSEWAFWEFLRVDLERLTPQGTNP